MRHATTRRNHIEISVAFVVAHEGDLRTIRRETWNHFDAFGRCQGQCDATFDRHSPKIVRIREDDLVIGDVGVAEHRRTTFLDDGHGGGSEKCEKRQGDHREISEG